MRAIKFRAWDSDEKLMIQWFPQFFSDMSPVTGFGSEFPDSEGSIVLMQYTGLKDKNGVEIYEGDIVQTGYAGIAAVAFHTKNIASCGCCFEAFSGSGFAAFNKLYGLGLDDECEVIGNIYENPELIPAEGQQQ
jgi:uncharacterized phage protein (TIGR01671 family)